jgi:hypothetical protein
MLNQTQLHVDRSFRFSHVRRTNRLENFFEQFLLTGYVSHITQMVTVSSMGFTHKRVKLPSDHHEEHSA